jgi:hypothetical protein
MRPSAKMTAARTTSPTSGWAFRHARISDHQLT